MSGTGSAPLRAASASENQARQWAMPSARDTKPARCPPARRRRGPRGIFRAADGFGELELDRKRIHDDFLVLFAFVKPATLERVSTRRHSRQASPSP